MQYLSRAYQYYSGINPATLSGAIDVIVVKRTNEDGETIYSCSPFHVRFGKLQVLRAGEKRVTIHLPNNIPAPHEAPFWMKVGEAGEAFFVLETDEEVPEELQTSPVIPAADAELLTPTPSDEEFGLSQAGGKWPGKKEDQPISEQVITQQPFGAEEEGSKKEGVAAEPTFLDLNADPSSAENGPSEELLDNGPPNADGTDSSPSEEASKVVASHALKRDSSSSTIPSLSPSSILNTATNLLPSFLHSSSAPDSDSTEKESHPPGGAPPPPNPLKRTTDRSEFEHHGAQTISQYVRHHKAKIPGLGRGKEEDGPIEVGPKNADEELPGLSEGEGEAPHVAYKDGIVLDMAGYHQQTEEGEEDASQARRASDDPIPSALSMDGIAGLYDRRQPQETMLGEVTVGDGGKQTAVMITFAQDLLSSAGSATSTLSASTFSPSTSKEAAPDLSSSQTAVIREIERRLGSLDLETPPVPPTSRLLAPFRDDMDMRRMRATSEPPPEFDETPGRSGMPGPGSSTFTSPPAVDYTWEWGGFPTKTPAVEKPDFFAPGSPPSPSRAVGDLPAPRPSLKPSPRDDLERSNSAPIPTQSRPDAPGTPERPTNPRLVTVPMVHAEEVVGPFAGRESRIGRLKNDEEDPYRFLLEMQGTTHVFELSLCGDGGFDSHGFSDDDEIQSFIAERVTFQRFIENPKVVDSPELVVKYQSSYLTWQNASPVLAALAIYRRSLLPPLPPSPAMDPMPPLSALGMDPDVVPPTASKGYAWSRWWRRGQSAAMTSSTSLPVALSTDTLNEVADSPTVPGPAAITSTTSLPLPEPDKPKTYYAKTLRLSSDQLKQLNLKNGANTIRFSVTSSYSGVASCTARIFLWDESDHVVISDIDGTITKSDALGHVFAAIGRDWTHLGVAKLYTDICNNGYKIMYLTSRAIGQADSTRDYLKGIHQGNYQLPEGPVIMSPDRLMASLHREVIMRKPELFKMACLRDIQRLFGGGSNVAFYAGFGNRITDAMSYRSVNVPSSRIFTIDSGGEVKMELLELAGYKSSYIHMTDLVDQMFPPINRKMAPEFTDFNFWKGTIPNIPIPDLAPPPSPTLTARSDSSGRLGVLRNITSSISRRTSRTTVSAAEAHGLPKHSRNSRPSSPLVGPSYSADHDSDMMSDDDDFLDDRRHSRGSSMPGSLPGSYDARDEYLNDDFFSQDRYDGAERGAVNLNDERERDEEDDADRSEEEEVDPEMFDDDLLATGEMSKVPY